MRVRFWGVRGSVPWTIPAAIGHGCNTPCLQIEDDATGEVVVFDAGSGIVGLGEALGNRPRDVTVVLTHYHWDHLQGLPFFRPLYVQGSRVRVLAPSLPSHDPAWLSTIFQSPFFPVPHERLPNPPIVEPISAGRIGVGSLDVSALPLNHPGGAFAYRIRGTTGDLVYATDHELGDPAYDDPLADFTRDAAALVIDSHFTPEELPGHRGWGHSDWRQCAELAGRCNAGGLWLFHHKPGRTDQQLVRIRSDAARLFPATETASEGERLAL
jgi:phosphoribosyl 1,2-cyclic phosphodiesterase